jgi:hypothetical protein
VHFYALSHSNEFISEFDGFNDLVTAFFKTVQRPLDIKNRPRIPIPDEDPYSEAAGSASSSGSSGLGGSGSAGEGSGSRDIGSVVAATREQLLMQSQGMKRSEKPPKLPPRDNLYPGALKVSVKH